eukprot:CAMPEP_0182475002 /NCGR_PEP_ID=MMETSP1319-20130603/26621_1 /TAXON_ID=172717 /ORGANISM="Bolidomonas pacifica, Strain RCC208" /LENGTH=250 /DNA_ID=CAMNT_0024675951 /DNA_START=185 /DNA_END=934 /DNA_ORIENTATION=+
MPPHKSSKPPSKHKKPSSYAAALAAKRAQRPMPSINNKMKRGEVYAKWLAEKKALKASVKAAKRQAAENPDAREVVEPKPQKTLESTRDRGAPTLTSVDPSDPEIAADEDCDEFAPYFAGLIHPKILVTTRPRPSAELFDFIQSLLGLFPNSFYWPRRSFALKEITEQARGKGFSHLMVLSEKSKVCNGVVVSHLGVPGRSSGVWDDVGGDDDDDDDDAEGGEEEDSTGEASDSDSGPDSDPRPHTTTTN